MKRPSTQKIKNQFKYKIPLYILMVLDWCSLIFGMRLVLYGGKPLLFNIEVIITVIGMQTGSINGSHEVFHKKDLFSQILGTLNLTKNLNMHFFIEHTKGHHRNVATDNDPASARKNESFGQFLPRTMIGQYKSAWEIENERCLRSYKTVYTWKNQMIWNTLNMFVTPLFVFYLTSFKGMILFVFIAFNSVVLLESINYIEHYGLRRKKLDDGSYENVNITHSWNAPHRLSNYLLFKLQRHSDHHENSRKPYQTLCTYDKSPLLPFSYTLAILLSQFSGLWFDIMNPVLEEYQKTGTLSTQMEKDTKRKVLKFILTVNLVVITSILIQAIN